MSDAFEVDLEAIRHAMEYQPSAEEQIEQRVDRMISELDELCRLATDPETVDLIAGQKIAIGQIVTRAQLVASFLMARHAPKLKMVQNNGG